MEYYSNRVKGLFTLNERVVLAGNWNRGFFALGLVGAYNVGSIRLTHEDITTNLPHELCYPHYHHRREFHPTWLAKQGEGVGTFELGSTVVMMFESPRFTWLVKPGDKVKMGQPLGYVDWTPEVREIVEETYPRMVEEGKQMIEGERVEEDGNDHVIDVEEEWGENQDVVIVEVDETPVVKETPVLMDGELSDEPVVESVEVEAAVEETVNALISEVEKQKIEDTQELVPRLDAVTIPTTNDEEEEMWWFTSEKKDSDMW